MGLRKKNADTSGSSASEAEWNDWGWQSRNRIRSIAQLASVLKKPAASFARLRPVLESYPMAITPYYLSLTDYEDEKDPLGRQCFPDPREITFSLGGVPDPLGEEGEMPVSGLIHRYPDRCLALVTGTCAVYCRHCNRKRMWRSNEPAGISRRRLQAMVEYVAGTSTLREVIISGGDPLLISDESLDWFLGALRAIPHLEILRIGSRAPVTLPMRITPKLCAILRRHRPLWFNTQFNHSREITAESARACDMILNAGIPVGNQSVLLNGVNDDYDSMRELLCGLARISVRPYYLFQCDHVRGTDHFRSEVSNGMEIMEMLRNTVSGLCLPRYVMDRPGSGGKLPLQRLSASSEDEIGAVPNSKL